MRGEGSNAGRRFFRFVETGWDGVAPPPEFPFSGSGAGLGICISSRCPRAATTGLGTGLLKPSSSLETGYSEFPPDCNTLSSALLLV